MSRFAYPLIASSLMLALAVVFHILALTTSMGDYLPIAALYITTLLIAFYSVLNYHFYQSSQKTGDKQFMNYILISKITRMCFFFLVFLVYCLAAGTKIRGFAVELVVMFFAYLVFDTVYLVRMKDEKKNVNHE